MTKVGSPHVQEIKEWEQDQTTFVETRATHHILRSLLLKNCIFVTGSSGCGKSSNIHHAALHLRDSFEYEIIPVLTGPTDIIKYYNENKKQVFVVDDICGKETINTHTLQMWRDYSEKMNKLFQIVERNVTTTNDDSVSSLRISSPKLLISCQLRIYKEAHFQRFTLFTKKECNLLSPELCLQEAERMLMLQKYLPDDIIDNIKQVTKNVDYFPLLCKLSKDKTSEEVLTLFTAPLLSIKNNINNIIIESKDHFCALVLCVLFDGQFDTNWLKLESISDRKKDKIENVLKEFDIDLRKKMHRISLKSGFSTLNGTFLKLRGTEYSMIHNKIYKMTAVICGKHLTECFIKYAPPEFIRNNFIFESLTVDYENDDLIILYKDLEEKYFQRLLYDLKENVITSTFHNYQLIYQTFRYKLITFLRSSDDAKTVLEKLDTIGCKIPNVVFELNERFEKQNLTTPLIESASYGYFDIVNFLIVNTICNVNMTDGLGNSPLYKASKRGHFVVVKILLDNSADVTQCNNDGESPLYVACKGGHTDIAQLLIQNKADVTQCNNNGESPLYVACKGGHTDIAQLLIQNKADVTQCNNNGKSPLNVACKEGHRNLVYELLKNKADVTQCNNNGESPLYVACKGGHTDIAQLFIQNKADVTQCNNNGESPLYVACKGGHTDIAQLLIQNKADVTQCNNNGESPLYVACKEGHRNSVYELLKNKADVTQCNNDGESPLYVACKGGHTDIAKLLIQNKADVTQCNNNGESPLYVACKGGHRDIAKLLIQNKADVTQCNNNGESPLYVACKGGHRDIAKLLIQNKADVTQCNNNDESPLYVACKGGHRNSVYELLQNKVDVTQCNNNGESPLYVACKGGHTDSVWELLQKKADVNQCNNNGESPLYVACKGGHTDSVWELLQKKADVNQCNNNGESPLYVACKGGYRDMVWELLQKKADVTQCNNNGESPLYVACKGGHTDSVYELLKNKADVTQCNNNGESPLHVACKGGHKDIVELVLQNKADVSHCNSFGESPLYVACKNGQTDIAQLLLQYNADVSQHEQLDGQSPLHAACDIGSLEPDSYKIRYFRKIETVKLLLEWNANAKFCNKRGQTPLDIARISQSMEIVNILEDNLLKAS
ncbi:ankyrin-1-like [Mytilus trossulus]|uniref:ankyrin-1-like n=1 Tax=Mytilus trossulus TaxID=6551 RepID=UPI003003F62F